MAVEVPSCPRIGYEYGRKPKPPNLKKLRSGQSDYGDGLPSKKRPRPAGTNPAGLDFRENAYAVISSS